MSARIFLPTRIPILRISIARVLCVLLISCGLSAQSPPARSEPMPIRFEDATAKSGIQFTHSFGARQLGSLLESTGAGCVWFDYNNDGLPDLYVVSGKPLDEGIHPYPLKESPATSSAQPSLQEQRRRHLHGRNRSGRSGGKHLRHGRDRGGLRQRWLRRSVRHRLRPRDSLPQQR